MSYSGDYINFHNSFGCGKSLRWEHQAIEIAKECKEDCGHLNICTIIVNLRGRGNDNIGYCRVKCPDCQNPFLETSRRLLKEYLEFYNRNSER